MRTHRGPAVLITDNGTEIKAGADLQASPTEWGGYLSIDTENRDLVINMWEGRVRLPSGAEGAFLRPNREAGPPRTDLPFFRIRIDGNGDAPF